MERADIDAVTVAVPNYLDEESLVAAAAAGKQIMCEKPFARTIQEAERMLKAVKDELYHEATKMGGVITAEHGVGKVRLKEVSMCVDEKQIELMRGLKRLFDPNGILNPGTAIP